MTFVSSTIFDIISFQSESTFPKSVAYMGKCFLISGDEKIGSKYSQTDCTLTQYYEKLRVYTSQSSQSLIVS